MGSRTESAQAGACSGSARLSLVMPMQGNLCQPSHIAARVIADDDAVVPQRLGCSIVPVHFFAPQRQPHSFLSLGVWRSSRVMP